MPRVLLTDAKIEALKPAKPGKRYVRLDSQVPGLLVRVSDKGKKSLMFYARWPGDAINEKTGKPNPSRRLIGEHGAVTTNQARDKAREWTALLVKGIDPRRHEEEQRNAALRAQQHTFRTVAEDYISYVHGDGQRKAETIEHELRTHFIARWDERPAASITLHDVRQVIVPVAKRAPYQAHNLFGYVRTLYSWALNSGAYGLEHSPCDRLKPKYLIGKKVARRRLLDDDELRAFWRATARLGDERLGGYPFGPLFRLLLLTGQRKTEISDMRWSELDLDKERLLTVPPERFKSDTTFLVPLSADAVELLRALPRPAYPKGEFVFSTTKGAKPVDGFSKAKARLDALMLEELRKLRGADTKLQPWVLHDLRRVVRTHLSWLGTTEVVAERVVGHMPKDPLQKVYNRYEYLNERRAALEAWAAKLRGIVEPPSPQEPPQEQRSLANVVPIRKRS